MKKSLIALAIAGLAATSAQATVVYNQDGTKIDIDGRAHFEIRNQKETRTDLYDLNSRLRVRAYQEITPDVTAFGGVELRFSGKDSAGQNAIGNNIRAHRLFGGVSHKEIGSLTFGRQLVLGDHIPKANYMKEWGGNVFMDAHSKSAHFMSKKFNGVRVAADYYFGDAGKEETGTTYHNGKDQGFGVGLFYDGKFDDLAVRFGSGYTKVKQGSTKATSFDLTRAGIGFDVKYDIVTVGFDWAHAKAEGKNEVALNFQAFPTLTPTFGDVNKMDRFHVGLKFDVTAQNSIYGAYYFGTAKKAAATEKSVKMRGWGIGADHKFNKFVTVYAEGGKGVVKFGDESARDHKLLVGAQVLF